MEAVTVPADCPFRYTSYPVTPTLSVDGVHTRTNELVVTDVAVNPAGAEAGV
ncbi:hypothetical protein D3C81_1826090 [compost metagenome]